LTRDPAEGVNYVLTRFVLLRLLGVVYAVAFAGLVLQQDALLGSDGLLPARAFLDELRDAAGSTGQAFAALPTLFWLDGSDAALHAAAWLGLALSIAVVLGATNALLQLALWGLYLSFVQVGQIFYGYGWEMQLLETGFLAVFLCPLLSLTPFGKAPPAMALWLNRWLIARIMLGAGLIKLRGDPCWRDLSCLVYHYETQPIPNPLSYWLHAQPRWFHVVGAAFNFLVELVAPLFAFWPRPARLVAGVLFVAFQLTLIASGNLSFLNWLTIVPAIACFDDAFLRRVAPRRIAARAAAAAEAKPASRAQRAAAGGFALLVGLLSIAPVQNLLSPHQAMNRSFDPLHLVNTYGAFGSVNRERWEVVIQGADVEQPDVHTRWRDYELPCKPGDVRRRPCLITPWHYRLDWQMWFAGMSDPTEEPWIVDLVYELLRGNRMVLRLFSRNPFPRHAPRWIRVERYRYHFVGVAEHRRRGTWWWREDEGEYVPPLSLDNEALVRWEESRSR